MKELSLQEIQAAALEVLKYTHELCVKHGIKYWLMYGTLLGAVRHNGFIPWDDDVDIAMRRSDYDRLISVLKKDTLRADNPFYIDHFSVSNDYPYYILRICDSRYKVMFENTKHVSGVFIDVYPFDDPGNNVQFWNEKLASTQFLKKLMILNSYQSWLYGNSLSHKILNIPLMVYSRIMGMGFLEKKMDRLSQYFNGTNSGNIGLTAWADRPVVFNEKLFDKLILKKFETIDVYIPYEYDTILRAVYGNYMELPSKEDQIPHHNYIAYRLEK